MSQAIPFVVFYVAALALGVALLLSAHWGTRHSAGTRTAIQAAARGASLQAKKTLWALGVSQTLVSSYGVWISFGATGAVLIHALTPPLLVLFVGGAAWLLGRVGLERAAEQADVEGGLQSQADLARSILGLILVASGLGALIGLFPTLVPELPHLGLITKLSAGLLLVLGASVSASTDILGLASTHPKRNFMSLVGVTAAAFFRPARVALLLTVVNLFVHAELGALLGRASRTDHNLGAYLLSVCATATVGLTLGLLAVRQAYGEPSRGGWLRSALVAAALTTVGAWLAAGRAGGSLASNVWPTSCLLVLLPVVVISALPFLIAELPPWTTLGQGFLMSSLAVGLVLLPAGNTDPDSASVSRYALLTVSGALLPLAVALQLAAEMPLASRQFGLLVLDGEDAMQVGRDPSLACARSLSVPLVLALAVGLGLRLAPASAGPLLPGAALLGGSLLAIALAVQRQQTQKGNLAGWSTSEREAIRGERAQAPQFARGLEVSGESARRAVIPPLVAAVGIIAIALGLKHLTPGALEVGIFGLWLGALITSALSLLRAPDAEFDGPSGHVAYSILLVGTAALAVVPAHY
jgi:hypothetical protein